MSVTRRGNKWRVRVYDGPGRMRHVGTFATKREAVQAEARELARDRKLDQTVTVNQWRERWLQDMRDELMTSNPRRRESTVLLYEQRTKPFAVQYGKLRLVDVTVPLAREYCLRHRSHHAPLSTMWADARLAGLVSKDDNPFSELRIPRSRGRKDLPADFLTPAKVDALMRAAVDVHGPIAGNMLSAFIAVAVETGLRRGELIALEHGDVDLQAGTIHVSRAWNERVQRVDVPKNGEAATVVIGALSRLTLQRVQEQPLHPVLVFTTKTGQPLRGSTLHYLLDPVRHRAGLPDLTVHWFRHYTATRLVESGLSDYDAAQQLRHRDGGELVRTTYAHRDGGQSLERVRQALNSDAGPLLTRPRSTHRTRGH